MVAERKARPASAPVETTSAYSLFRDLQRARKSSSTVGVGVVGYGYWGPNLVRNFAECGAATLVAVSDLSVERLTEVHARYPHVKVTTDCGDLIADPAVDAVIIATPVSSHYELAMRALRAGKHVMVTKPITAEAAQAMELIDEAEQRGLVLMVDHTFVYTGAVQTIKQVVESGNLGELYYYDSVRVNLGLFQKDINVTWDLAPHDISIVLYLMEQMPVTVNCVGNAHVTPGIQDVTNMALAFEGLLKGSSTSNKQISIRFVGRDGAIVISESAILFPGETEVPDDVRKVNATWVLEKRDGQWLIAAYHNSPVL